MLGVCAEASPQVKATANTIVIRRQKVRVRVICIDGCRYDAYSFCLSGATGRSTIYLILIVNTIGGQRRSPAPKDLRVDKWAAETVGIGQNRNVLNASGNRRATGGPGKDNC